MYYNYNGCVQYVLFGLNMLKNKNDKLNSYTRQTIYWEHMYTCSFMQLSNKPYHIAAKQCIKS